MIVRTALALGLAAMAAGVALLAQAGQPASTSGQVPQAVTLRMIVVGTAPEATVVRERLDRGEAFATVAREVSIDPSAVSGGLLGRLDLASLREPVRLVLQGLKPGQFSPVAPVATGFAVFELVSDLPGQPTPINPVSFAAISGIGAVKFVPDIGGLPEAEALLRDFPKAANWNESPRTICQARQDSLTAGTELFERFFSPEAATFRSSRPPFELMQAHLGMAQVLAYQGSMSRAVEHYDAAYRIAVASVPTAVPQVEEMLAVALMHKAAMDNAVFRQPGELCLLPPRPGVAYAKRADLDRAAALFTTFLERRPDDPEGRWLLNLAHMALGSWPDRVPERHRIPASAFASPEDVGRFVDVAPSMGLDVFASAGGVIVDDLANSGRFDVMTSNFYSCGPLHYFAAKGDGTYAERGPAAGLRDQVGGLSIIQADYDNDRCTDVLVQRGGWEVAQRRSLLRNNCDGTFTDVTAAAGLATPVTASQAGAWADINNDGWLDLFVGNEDARAQLFLNDGTGHFTDIAARAGVNRQTFAKSTTAGDYDNDGFVDFYVSNYDGPNLLYRNNHDNTFTERAIAAGVPGPGRGFTAWFFDYDNDGWLDLFATSYFMSVDDTARTYLGLPHNAPTLKLYRNRGNGTFEDVTRAAALDRVFMPMGANFGDLDNDGLLDMYLGMGTPSYASVAPHVLLRNNGGRFIDVTASSGTGEIHKGHGIAFADLDFDGDEDIVAEIGGATPADSHAMRVFENPGHGNDWIALKLTGVKTNRSAFGARISVTVENGGTTRTIHRLVGGGGTFGSSPLEQHIGLGPKARIVDLEVFWPAANARQRFGRVPANRAYAIEEGGAPMPIVRQAIRLGGSRRVE
ncbi:MAG: FG-GAP-like repeat-containing protein [Vicinamibacterales bacterium]